jgi:aerotaxis receptor
MKSKISPTQNEVHLRPDEVIVSKTDLSGRITYANRAFMRVADFSETDLLGVQHNIVRHPDMPRGAFQLLWDTLKQGHEFFGYVKNMDAHGNYYWVFANVTPDRDLNGKVVGYFSVRRTPSRSAVSTIQTIYKELLSIEAQAGVAKAPVASIDYLHAKLKSLGTTYDRFIVSL